MHVGCRASLANKGGSAAELVRMAVRENEMLEVPQRAAPLSNGVESDGRLTGKPASTMTGSGPLSRMNALTDQKAVKTAHPIAQPDGYFWRLDKSFTQKYLVCTPELRLGRLVHTQAINALARSAHAWG